MRRRSLGEVAIIFWERGGGNFLLRPIFSDIRKNGWTDRWGRLTHVGPRNHVLCEVKAGRIHSRREGWQHGDAAFLRNSLTSWLDTGRLQQHPWRNRIIRSFMRITWFVRLPFTYLSLLTYLFIYLFTYLLSWWCWAGLFHGYVSVRDPHNPADPSRTPAWSCRRRQVLHNPGLV